MKPVHQTIFNDDEAGVVGNCWQAAVASLLHADLDEVPHFMTTEDPWGAYIDFIAEQGFAIVLTTEPVPDCYGLATGPSPRGVLHAVITLGADLAHDPHPSGAGLVQVLTFEYLVRIDRLGALVPPSIDPAEVSEFDQPHLVP